MGFAVVCGLAAALSFVLGVLIYRGRTDLVHEYHRTFVRDHAGYGKAVGAALLMLGGFLLLAAVKRRTAAYTVLSLTHPDPAMPRRLACRFLQPDLVLTQSAHWEQLFKAAGCRNLQFVPNGVDTARFKPATPDEKRALRQKYELSPDAFIVLHVGNTRTVRQLDVLPRLRQAGCEVIVVSSTTIRGDGEMDDRLTQAGCRIWNHYIEAVEEVYALADCYVFPLAQGVGAIEHPLSVIEAMATNLPVITRRFGALPPPRGQLEVELEDGTMSVRDAVLGQTLPFSMCGLPALSIPVGLVEGSYGPGTPALPAGLQLVGRFGGDAALLALGRWVEAQVGEAVAPPGY